MLDFAKDVDWFSSIESSVVTHVVWVLHIHNSFSGVLEYPVGGNDGAGLSNTHQQQVNDFSNDVTRRGILAGVLVPSQSYPVLERGIAYAKSSVRNLFANK